MALWLIAMTGAILLGADARSKTANTADSRAGGRHENQGLATQTPNSANKTLLREGERLSNQQGEFRLVGEGVTFVPTSGPPMQVLPNLTLERVVNMLQETRGRREWTVTGTITEFRGSNYLLATRAVLNSRPQP